MTFYVKGGILLLETLIYYRQVGPSHQEGIIMVIFYQDGSSPDVCKRTDGGYLHTASNGTTYFIPFDEISSLEVGKSVHLKATQYYDHIEKKWVETTEYCLIGSVVSRIGD